MLLCKIAIFMMLCLTHHLHTHAVCKEIVKQQLRSRCPLVLDSTGDGHYPWDCVGLQAGLASFPSKPQTWLFFGKKLRLHVHPCLDVLVLLHEVGDRNGHIPLVWIRIG